MPSATVVSFEKAFKMKQDCSCVSLHVRDARFVMTHMGRARAVVDSSQELRSRVPDILCGAYHLQLTS